MRQVMVRYKVKDGRAAENEGFITKVFEQLAREKPDGLRYRAIKLDDGVTFVHIATVDRTDDVNPLTSLPSFKAFTAGIPDRCEELPKTAHFQVVGTYESR